MSSCDVFQLSKEPPDPPQRRACRKIFLSSTRAWYGFFRGHEGDPLIGSHKSSHGLVQGWDDWVACDILSHPEC